MIRLVLIITTCVSCREDDFLDGIDRQTLVATPNQQEIDDVVADWNARDLSVHDYTVIQTVGIAEATFKIVSFRVGGLKEYGALLIPESGTAMPLRMYIGGFSLNVTVNSIVLAASSGAVKQPYAFAIPALRGQSLSVTLNGIEYTTPISDGDHCNAFDGATDDAIAFLNVIASTENQVDTERVSVRGGSRGATVALLMGERDQRVKISIAVAGPADLMTLTSASENDATYQCQFLAALVDNSSDIPTVRHTLIASSPIYFADKLPKTQVHLGAEDKIVPVVQGDELKEVVEAVPNHKAFELYVYQGRGHADIASDNVELQDRVESFFWNSFRTLTIAFTLVR
jgi:dienelactone hydrolase